MIVILVLQELLNVKDSNDSNTSVARTLESERQ